MSYCDFGNSEEKMASHLRQLLPQFLKHPAQAHKARLVSGAGEGILWKEVVVDQEYKCHVVGTEKGLPLVQLKATSTPLLDNRVSPPNSPFPTVPKEDEMDITLDHSFEVLRNPSRESFHATSETNAAQEYSSHSSDPRSVSVDYLEKSPSPTKQHSPTSFTTSQPSPFNKDSPTSFTTSQPSLINTNSPTSFTTSQPSSIFQNSPSPLNTSTPSPIVQDSQSSSKPILPSRSRSLTAIFSDPNKVHSILVTYFIGFEKFFIQQREDLDILNGMMERLEAAFSETAAAAPPPLIRRDDFVQGLKVAAKYSEDGRWYRAEVTSVSTSDKSKTHSIKTLGTNYDFTVEVFFFDYGNVESYVIPPDQSTCECLGELPLKDICPNLVAQPAFAYECRLPDDKKKTESLAEHIFEVELKAFLSVEADDVIMVDLIDFEAPLKYCLKTSGCESTADGTSIEKTTKNVEDFHSNRSLSNGNNSRRNSTSSTVNSSSSTIRLPHAMASGVSVCGFNASIVETSEHNSSARKRYNPPGQELISLPGGLSVCDLFGREDSDGQSFSESVTSMSFQSTSSTAPVDAPIEDPYNISTRTHLNSVNGQTCMTKSPLNRMVPPARSPMEKRPVRNAFSKENVNHWLENQSVKSLPSNSRAQSRRFDGGTASVKGFPSGSARKLSHASQSNASGRITASNLSSRREASSLSDRKASGRAFPLPNQRQSESAFQVKTRRAISSQSQGRQPGSVSQTNASGKSTPSGRSIPSNAKSSYSLKNSLVREPTSTPNTDRRSLESRINGTAVDCTVRRHCLKMNKFTFHRRMITKGSFCP